MLAIGSTVRLLFFPFCVGTITDVEIGFSVGPMVTSKKYQVTWNDEKLGVSGWLSENDVEPVDLPE